MCRLRVRDVKVEKKSLQSSELTSSGGHGVVFSFSGGVRNNGLFLYGLGDGTRAKLNEETSGGTMSSWTTGPVRVSVTSDLKKILNRIEKTLARSRFKIA